MNVLEGDFKDWDKSGLIAGTALEFGRKMIKPGVRVLDVTLAVEKKIFDMGGELAFPAQINFNEIAAHDCAHHNDDRVFKEELSLHKLILTKLQHTIVHIIMMIEFSKKKML